MTFDEEVQEILNTVMTSDALATALETPNDVIVLADDRGRVRVSSFSDFRSYYRQHCTGSLINQIDSDRVTNEHEAVPVLVLGNDEGQLFWVTRTNRWRA